MTVIRALTRSGMNPYHSEPLWVHYAAIEIISLTLIGVEQHFHLRPPVPFHTPRRSTLDRLLQGIGKSPPLAGLRISCDGCHVCLKIIACVFHIGKQQAIPMENAIIADIGLVNGFQYLRPYRCM